MKFKLRLQMMIGLLFIAITISVIAVSVAWYSAGPGDITVQGSEVSVTTADNNYSITVGYNLIGQVTSIGNDNLCTVNQSANSYLGEDGLSEEYMLLFEVTGEEALTNDAYVSKCTTSVKDNLGQSEFSYASKALSEFQILFAEKVDGNYYVTDEVSSYIIIVFGNGNDTFNFSDRQFLGTTFKLEVALG